MNADKINIKTLKKFVYENFPPDSLLGDLILTEPEQMTVQEFIIKTETWLRLAKRVLISSKSP